MAPNWLFIMIILGVIAVGLLIMLICFVAKKRPGIKYDERQQLARGKAYKAAFLVLMAYSVIQGFVVHLLDFVWCDALTGSFIGIILSLTVFVVLCILSDAYIALSENPKSVMTVLIIVGAGNLISSISAIVQGDYVNAEGQLTFRSLNMFVALMFIVILAVFIAKRLYDRNKAETEQE